MVKSVGSPAFFLVAIYRLLLVTRSGGNVPTDCPSKCSCIEDIVTHCSGQNIASKQDWLNLNEHFEIAKILHLGYNNFSCAAPYFLGSSGFSLNFLFLQNNSISDIDENAFANLPKLTKLDLSHNNLRSLQSRCVTGVCADYIEPCNGTRRYRFFYEVLANSLQNLILSHNRIRSVPNGSFRKMLNLKTLSLDNNNIAWIAKRALVGLDTLQAIHLRNNPLAPVTSVKLNMILSILSPFHPYNCRKQRCSHGPGNNLVDSVTTAIDLGETRITHMNIHFPTSLHFLYLDNNFIGYIPRHRMHNLPLLSHLYLNGNQIKVLEDGIFRNLSSLKLLDLSRNQITLLGRRPFSGLLRLKSLRIFNNHGISHINSDMFDDIPSLRLLYIQNCSITTIPIGSWLFRLLAIWMYGNPIDCTCQWVLFYDLRSWKLQLDPYRNRTWGDFDTWEYQEDRKSICSSPDNLRDKEVKRITRRNAGCTELDIKELLENDDAAASIPTSSFIPFQDDEHFDSPFDNYIQNETNTYYTEYSNVYANSDGLSSIDQLSPFGGFSGLYNPNDYDYLMTSFPVLNRAFLSGISFYNEAQYDLKDLDQYEIFSGDYY